LGLINYYRKLIPRCSALAEPLTRLLRKNSSFEWKSEQNEAFNKLKGIIGQKTFLTHPDLKKRFVLETGAKLVLY
jgi:hypothetical protein